MQYVGHLLEHVGKLPVLHFVSYVIFTGADALCTYMCSKLCQRQGIASHNKCWMMRSSSTHTVHRLL